MTKLRVRIHSQKHKNGLEKIEEEIYKHHVDLHQNGLSSKMEGYYKLIDVS